MAQHTIFGSTVPANLQNADTQQVNLSSSFYITSGTTWTVTGIRFYLDAASVGSSSGYEVYLSYGDDAALMTLLSSKAASSVTKGGWNDVTLDSPVSISVGTKYWATVYFPGGGYSNTPHTFDSPVQASDGSPLYGSATSEVTPGNGVYNYNGPGVMLGASTYNANWYGIDVLADDGVAAPAPPPPTNPDPTVKASILHRSWAGGLEPRQWAGATQPRGWNGGLIRP